MTIIMTEARRRWRAGEFIETGCPIPGTHEGVPWVPYETYMMAQLVDCKVGQPGLLIVDFPPEATEDNELHRHPVSDRVITVIRGSGTFMALRRGSVQSFALEPGHRVWMPRGILHTFMSGPEGLTVESIHNPWVPFTDPLCLIYPRPARSAS